MNQIEEYDAITLLSNPSTFTQRGYRMKGQMVVTRKTFFGTLMIPWLRLVVVICEIISQQLPSRYWKAIAK